MCLRASPSAIARSAAGTHNRFTAAHRPPPPRRGGMRTTSESRPLYGGTRAGRTAAQVSQNARLHARGARARGIPHHRAAMPDGIEVAYFCMEIHSSNGVWGQNMAASPAESAVKGQPSPPERPGHIYRPAFASAALWPFAKPKKCIFRRAWT